MVGFFYGAVVNLDDFIILDKNLDTPPAIEVFNGVLYFFH